MKKRNGEEGKERAEATGITGAKKDPLGCADSTEEIHRPFFLRSEKHDLSLVPACSEQPKPR